MAIKCINFGTPTTVDELNDALNEGYKFQFTAGVVMWLHKPDARQRQTDFHVSVGDPEAFKELISKMVTDNGDSLDSARDLPNKATSFNEWYGVRDIP